MQRRDFVKSAMCLSCLGLMNSGCNSILDFQNTKVDIKNSKFLYKSKSELPKMVRIEACSLCQLNCPACSIRLREKEMPKDWLGYLKFSDFKKFIDENDFIEEIEISNNGEVFLNPELNDIIKYAHQKNVKLTALSGTNLNTVSNETLENLVKYQFKALTVSIDGATQKTYEIYRVGGNLNTVIENINKINEYKKKYNSIYPEIICQFILFGHNEHEIEDIKKLAKKLNIGLKFKRNVFPNYSPVKNPKLVEKLTGLPIYDDIDGLIKDSFKRQKKYACKLLFYKPQIDYDGKILGCCRIFDFKANAFKDGLLNALNSPTVVYAKHMLTDLSVPERKDVPCVDCITYKYIKEKKAPVEIS